MRAHTPWRLGGLNTKRKEERKEKKKKGSGSALGIPVPLCMIAVQAAAGSREDARVLVIYIRTQGPND